MQTQDVTVTLQPERLRMSYEDYLQWADEDVHAEWVDGEVIIQMPPRNTTPECRAVSRRP